MKYLAAKFGVGYPQNDVRGEAKMWEYLDWHHGNIRYGTYGFFIGKFMSQMIGKQVIPLETVSQRYELIGTSL